MLREALDYQNAGDYVAAESLYREIISSSPSDYNAYHYLGVLLFQTGRFDEALKVLHKSLDLNPSDPYVYNNLAALYRALGQLSDATESYRRAIGLLPDFAGAHANLGRVLFELGKVSEAESAYRNALSIDSSMIDVWNELGKLLYFDGSIFDAEEAYRTSLGIIPNQIEALRGLGTILNVNGEYGEYELVLRHALEIKPDSSETWCTLGSVLMALGRLDDAESAFLQAIAYNDSNIDALVNYANILRIKEQYCNAEAICVKILAATPNYAPALCNLGNIYFDCGNLTAAEQAYRNALVSMPEFVAAHCNLGNVLLASSRFAESEEEYKMALELDPFFVDAYVNLASLYRELGRLHEAEEACREALIIRPDSSEALNNFASVLLELGSPIEAEQNCMQSIKINPDFAEAHCTLGNIFCELERLEEAEDSYRHSLACKPNYAEAYSNLGGVLNELGRYQEATVAFTRALELNPQLHACRIKLAMISLPLVVATQDEADAVQYDFSLALDELEMEANKCGFGCLGKTVGVMQPFNLAYRTGNHLDLLSHYGDITCRMRSAWHDSVYTEDTLNTGISRTRIRLLIVTGHVRRHSVWDVILHGLLRHLDRNRFEVFVYHTVARVDDETLGAHRYVDKFVQGPANWLSLVKDDVPDIIFYPEIGMDSETLRLASLRLAPLQIASWGHPITTGLPTIDIFLSGELLERCDAESDYRERLILLPGTGACSVLMPFSQQAFDTERAVLSSESVKFLICQQAIKFDPSVDVLFVQIASLCDECAFWVIRDRKYAWATELIEKRLRNAFKASGLDLDHYVHFVDWLPGSEFCKFMAQMDIFLDLPSFSGYTTAWQAIHCGLPIVTYEGPYLRQRLAAGLLRKIDVTETIASDHGDYVTIAALLAQYPEKRRDISELYRNRAVQLDEDVAVVRRFEDIVTDEYMKLLTR